MAVPAPYSVGSPPTRRRIPPRVFRLAAKNKDLASVVWETALAAFQAVAAEPPRAPRRVRGRPEPNAEDRNGHGSGLQEIFRPQNCGAVCPNVASDKLSADDPRLLLFSKGFWLQSGRSTTDARRAGDRKLTRLVPRSEGGTSAGPGNPRPRPRQKDDLQPHGPA